jgi:signal transduction histidine kinase
MDREKKAVQKDNTEAGLEIVPQDLLDSIEDELLVIDSEFRVQFANSTMRRKIQEEARPPVGRLCYEVFHDRESPCCKPLWECPLKKILNTARATNIIHHEQVAGVDRFIKLTAYPLADSHGNIKAVVELRRDVTAERELETQILRRHHQLLAMSQISGAVSELWDLDSILRIALDNVLEIMNGVVGGILLIDEETQTLYYRVYRGIAAHIAEKVHLKMGEGVTGTVAQTGKPVVLEDISTDPGAVSLHLVRREGLKGFVSVPLRSKETVLGVIYVASYSAGRFGADDMALLNSIGDYLGTAVERAKLYQKLAMASERYETLLQHALTAQEQERKRIAQELHDETSQSLTSLTLSLQAIIGMAEMKGIKDKDIMEKLKATHSYAVHAGNEIVKLMKELRPTLLDELGLPAAVHRYAKDTLQIKGINMSAEFTGMDKRLPPEVEVTLFRVAQGAIGNILEHSGAKNTSIKLTQNAGECLLRIEDDGKGFDVSKLTKVDASGRGTGVFTMKERVKLVGGACHIESGPGKGTKVIIKVPLKKGHGE